MARSTREMAVRTGNRVSDSAILSAIVLGMSRRDFSRVLLATVRQLLLAETTSRWCSPSRLMNYSGATATMAWRSGHRRDVSIFSALLGWVGVFLTGSDTSANALFGIWQV